MGSCLSFLTQFIHKQRFKMIELEGIAKYTELLHAANLSRRNLLVS